MIECYKQNNNFKTFELIEDLDQDIDLHIHLSAENYCPEAEDVEISDHPSDNEVRNEMKCKETCGKYFNESEIHTTLMMLDGSLKCSCPCHRSDKLEMHHDDHCKDCLKKILKRLEKANANYMPEPNEID